MKSRSLCVQFFFDNDDKLPKYQFLVSPSTDALMFPYLCRTYKIKLIFKNLA